MEVKRKELYDFRLTGSEAEFKKLSTIAQHNDITICKALTFVIERGFVELMASIARKESDGNLEGQS